VRHEPPNRIDREAVAVAMTALDGGPPIVITRDIRNGDRAVGALLAGEIARRAGDAGLPDDSIVLRVSGSAGQSFGAFATRGLTLVPRGRGE
jgi:glutamate synthase (NADPH/NADH) large chain